MPIPPPSMPLANSDYRIEKERVTVTITTESGERLVGDIFVQSYARNRAGREEAIDVLNADEPYFPLALPDRSTLLVAKRRVRDVELPEGAAGVTALARPATVEVILAGGDALLGEVLLEVPIDRPRLLDFLNRFDQRFVTLHTADGLRLLNRHLIERVRPLD